MVVAAALSERLEVAVVVVEEVRLLLLVAEAVQEEVGHGVDAGDDVAQAEADMASEVAPKQQPSSMRCCASSCSRRRSGAMADIAAAAAGQRTSGAGVVGAGGTSRRLLACGAGAAADSGDRSWWASIQRATLASLLWIASLAWEYSTVDWLLDLTLDRPHLRSSRRARRTRVGSSHRRWSHRRTRRCLERSTPAECPTRAWRTRMAAGRSRASRAPLAIVAR